MKEEKTMLKHVSMRLHEDVVKRIEYYASRENKLFSKYLRELVFIGMDEAGIIGSKDIGKE